MLPLGCGLQLKSCLFDVPQGEDFLSILLEVIGEGKEGGTKARDNKKQDADIIPFLNVPNIIPSFRIDAPLEFKHQEVAVSMEESTFQKLSVQKEEREAINTTIPPFRVDSPLEVKHQGTATNMEESTLQELLAQGGKKAINTITPFMVDTPLDVKHQDFATNIEESALQKLQEEKKFIGHKGFLKPKGIENVTVHGEVLDLKSDESNKEVGKIRVSGRVSLDSRKEESLINHTNTPQFLKEDKNYQGKAKEQEKTLKQEVPYPLESFKKTEPTGTKELLKPLPSFQKTQLDNRDIMPEGQEIEEKPLQEEKLMDDLPFHSSMHKGEATSIKQEGANVESVKGQEHVINYEPKQISIKLDETFLRLNLFGDRLRLSVNIKEEIYRPPTEFEVQRLVQSLQDLGFSLEVLKLNGSMLYHSDQRQNKREDRERGLLNNFNEDPKVSRGEKKSFSLYL